MFIIKINSLGLGTKPVMLNSCQNQYEFVWYGEIKEHGFTIFELGTT